MLKTIFISGISWSLLDKIVGNVVLLVIGIFLSRLLTPHQFGVIGICNIFISFLTIVVEGGLGRSIVQRKECSQSDLSTVFFYNIFVSTFIYFLVYTTSLFLESYFNVQGLSVLLKVMGLSLIISSLGIVQEAVLSRNVKFKVLTKVSVLSQTISGVAAIYFAFVGFGYWSLVIRTLAQSLIASILLAFFSGWKPSATFNIKSFKILGAYGNRVLGGAIINWSFYNSFYFIIGKIYSPTQLGYFSRADMFSKLPVQNVSLVFHKVALPVLSTIQDDEHRLKNSYKQLLKVISFVSFMMMFGLAACSKNFVLIVLGARWLECVKYMQILSCATALYAPNILNLNILLVKGRSDLFLKAEFLNKLIVVPIIILGALYSINWLLFGMLIFSITSYLWNARWCKQLISYSVGEQMRDMLPGALVTASAAVLILLGELMLNGLSEITVFVVQVTIFLFATIAFCEWFKIDGYLILKRMAQQFWNSRFGILKP
jgi:O-antigen/teichoic acid export membrane protein